MLKKIAVTILTMVVMSAGTASASMTLASWNMAGQPGDQEYTAGIDSDYATAENMDRGTGLTPYATYNSLSSVGWAGIDADDYVEFGFTLADGYKALLNELWIGTRSSGTGPGTIGVYTSLDDFTNPVFTITQPNSTYVNSVIDLSVLGTVTGSFYVRLIEIGNTQADGSGDTADTGTLRITDHYDAGTYTDVQFTGDVSVVPLPAAAWLFGSGLVGLAGLRRRQG